MARKTDHLGMTIAVVWDVKQTRTYKNTLSLNKIVSSASSGKDSYRNINISALLASSRMGGGYCTFFDREHFLSHIRKCRNKMAIYMSPYRRPVNN